MLCADLTIRFQLLNDLQCVIELGWEESGTSHKNDTQELFI